MSDDDIVYINPFLKTAEEYKRDFDIEGNYYHLILLYLQKRHGMSESDARTLIKENIQKAVSPKINLLKREVGMDRHRDKMDLISFLKLIRVNRLILSPNMVALCPPDVEESYLAGFIRDNMAFRSKVKKAGAVYKEQGNEAMEEYHELWQGNIKIRNNSISGASCLDISPLYSPSTHQILTTVTRSFTSTANAINEKVFASNRHYFSPAVTIENILYIISTVDMDLLVQVVDKYELNAPTAEECMAMTLENTSNYWHSDSEEERIRELIFGLNNYERIAYYCCNDFNGLCNCNEGFMREWTAGYFKVTVNEFTDPDKDYQKAVKTLKGADEDLQILTYMLNNEMLAGTSIFALGAKEPSKLLHVANHYKSLVKHVMYYSDFIKVFMGNDIRPQHIHEIPTINRIAVVSSDTDSSIFSMQKQVNWFYGYDKTGPDATKICGIMTYIAGSMIAHNLAALCAQMGVVPKDVFFCTMKNEFHFPVMVVTTRTKHYLALKDAREGKIYDKLDNEIKGVNLRNSKLPGFIRSTLKDYQLGMMNRINDGLEMDPMHAIATQTAIEHFIRSTIESGDASIYRFEKAKTEDTYALPKGSPYQKIHMWNQVFGPKYGKAEELPAECLKVPVDLDSKKLLKKYVDSLPADMRQAFEQNNQHWGKTSYTYFLVPIFSLVDNKIPKEILAVVNTKAILRSMIDAFYITAECYGMYGMNRKDTFFYSDYYSPEDIKPYLVFPLGDLEKVGFEKVEDDEETDDIEDMDDMDDLDMAA